MRIKISKRRRSSGNNKYEHPQSWLPVTELSKLAMGYVISFSQHLYRVGPVSVHSPQTRNRRPFSSWQSPWARCRCRHCCSAALPLVTTQGSTPWWVRFLETEQGGTWNPIHLSGHRLPVGIFKKVLLNSSWCTRLCWFLRYSEVIQSPRYTHSFSFRFFSHIDDHRILARGPCAAQQVPVGHSVCLPQCLHANPQPPVHRPPHLSPLE